jgi:hypothetical protein
MRKYNFLLTPWTIQDHGSVNDIFYQTFELPVLGMSFKDALRQLYKSHEFDKYIHINTTVWVYWKSCFNGKLYLIPDYEDVDIQ